MRWGIISLVVVLLAGGAFLLIQYRRAELASAPASNERPLPVSVTRTRRGQLKQSKHYLGQVKANRQTTVTARVRGEIRKIHVNEGDTVAAGELLVELDAREIEKELASVKQNVKQAQAELQAVNARLESLRSTTSYWEKEFNRRKKLYERGVVSASEFDQSRKQYENSRGELNAVRREKQALHHRIKALEKKREGLAVKKSYHRLRSPYPAQITREFIDRGELAAPSKKLIELENLSGQKVTFQLPQSDLEQLSEGQPVEYSYRGKEYTARLDLLYPAFEKSRLMIGEIWLDDADSPEFPSGAYLPLDVIYNQRKDQVLVDATGLVESPSGATYLFAVRDNQLVDREVKVLGRTGEQVAVKGIEPGRQVVEHTYLGWTLLNAGREVVVADGHN